MPFRSRGRFRPPSRSGALPSYDFSTLTAGAASLPAGLVLTRASANGSVQIGTSQVATGIAADVARAGRRLDADPIGLVIEEARTNLVTQARSMAAGSGWAVGTASTATANATPSPDGSTNAWRQVSTAAQYGNYFTRNASDGLVQVSEWGRATSAPFTCRTQIGAGVDIALTLAWQRFVASHTAAGLYFITPQNASGSAPTQDGLWDLFQIEVGAFATEWTPQSSTRAADRLVCTLPVANAGRLSLDVTLQPKGARSVYAADPYLVYLDASNYVQLLTATGYIKCAVGGVTYTTPIGVTFAAYDTVKLRVEVGANASTLVTSQVNSDPTVLLSTGTPTALGNWPVGNVDLFGNAGSNVLSAWVRALSFDTNQGEWV